MTQKTGAGARGGLVMPIHWGLFNLALHAWKQPVERIVEVADEKGIQAVAAGAGARLRRWPGAELRSGWWERAE